MKHQNVSALVQSGQAVAALTREQRFDIAITALKLQGHRKLKLFTGLEFLDLADLRAIGTTETVLEPVAEALNRAGLGTEQTVGSVMDSMKLTRTDVHCLVCDCHIGESAMECNTIALVLLARKERGLQAQR